MSASHAGAVPPAPIAALPTDVLHLILDLLPLRPRLRVAARVCKHWRTAAYATVTSITSVTGDSLERFPNLTAIIFDHEGVADREMEPNQHPLRRLRAVHFHECSSGFMDEAARHLRLLTSLRVLAFTYASLRPVVEACAATLTHLDLGGKWSNPANSAFLPDMRDIAFPALRTLVLRDWGAMANALERIAPDSLTHVTHLEYTLRTLTCPAALFTSLRHLTLRSWIAGDKYLGWLASLPLLNTLELGTMEVGSPVLVPPLITQTAPVLAALSLQSDKLVPFTPIPALTDALRLCTKLRHIGLIAPKAESQSIDPLLPCVLPVASQLTSLFLHVHPEVPTPDLAIFRELITSLTTLHLDTGFDVPNWRLPHLTELSVGSTPRSLGWVADALRTQKSLLRFTAESTEADSAHVEPFKAEVRAADKRGMRLVDVGELSGAGAIALGRAGFAALRQELCWLTLRGTHSYTVP